MVKRVVVTGGPSAGKSTVLGLAEKTLAAKGWTVFRVPEAASLLHSMGCNLGTMGTYGKLNRHGVFVSDDFEVFDTGDEVSVRR